MHLSTRVLLVLFVCSFAVMCNELLPGCSSRGAPAPLAKRGRDLFVGEWILVYGGSTYDMSLHKNNGYEARLNGTVWTGSWSARGSTLLVHETSNKGESWLLWSVDLDGNMIGVTNTGVNVNIKSAR